MPANQNSPLVGPDPLTAYPLPAAPRVGFLKPLVNSPSVEIGDYTYYDHPEGPEKFCERAILYHYPHMKDRLVIGKFCAIADGVRFVMNGANHSLDGLSTFPFAIFGNGWNADEVDWAKGSRGDTHVGNDVWIGMGATIMPGVRIGDGAIIGALAVVARDVPPYAVVAGNPAQVVKRRFDAQTIDRLLAIAWWDWPADKITQAIPAITNGDLDALEGFATDVRRSIP